MVRTANDALGKVVKSARLEMGLTREKCAEMVGLSPRYIMSIENENRKPAFDKLCKTIQALGVHSDEIFYPGINHADTSTQRLARLLSQCDEHEIKAITALVVTLQSEKKLVFFPERDTTP